jgi:pimeloyl-ACP methyl ester carboxylesterase
VTCPVLVVAGGLDPVCGADAAAEIVAALPTGLVRLCQFPGARHHIHRDQPDGFFPLLREFVAG